MSKIIEKLNAAARTLEDEQRNIKHHLRLDHREIGLGRASNLMSNKYYTRQKLRAHYLVTAFLKGQPYRMVESKSTEPVNYMTVHHAKNIITECDLEDTAFHTFQRWLTN